MQVGGSARALEIVVAVEAGRDDDRVDLLVVGEQVDDRLVDELVGGTVEVLRREHLDDVDDRGGTQQHGAEHALLGLVVVRRLAEFSEGGAVVLPALEIAV